MIYRRVKLASEDGKSCRRVRKTDPFVGRFKGKLALSFLAKWLRLSFFENHPGL